MIAVKLEGLPVKGYVAQSPEKVALVNSNKETEELMLRGLELMMKDPTFDARWVAIARSHFEQGYMALNRAIFCPARLKLPGDPA